MSSTTRFYDGRRASWNRMRTSSQCCTTRGHSMETEVREILESAVSPDGRVKLGSLLADMGRRAELTDAEFAEFEQVRNRPLPAR
jgi:plasmid stability protein